MSLKRFFVFATSVFSVVMAVAIASASEDEKRYPLGHIVDSQSPESQTLVLTASTFYPDNCYTPVRTLAKVDSANHQIRLSHFVTKKNQLCNQRVVADNPKIAINPIAPGLYTVVDDSTDQVLAEVETE